MTANALAAASTPPAMNLERVSRLLLLAFVGALQISIAAADILFAAVLLCWGVRVVRERSRLEAPAFFVPLVGYAGLTLVSAGVLVRPARERHRQPAAPALARGPGGLRHRARVASGRGHRRDRRRRRRQRRLRHRAVCRAPLRRSRLAARGRADPLHDLLGRVDARHLRRPARLVFATRDRLWPALVMPALIVALSLTLSRGAWVGACVGVGLLLVLKDLRLSALVPVLVAVVFALAPDSVTDRMTVDLQPAATRPTATASPCCAPARRWSRTTRCSASGPNMVRARLPAVPGRRTRCSAINPHLHNVPVQIAAERGLPALGVWLWFVVVLARDSSALFRARRPVARRPPAWRRWPRCSPPDCSSTTSATPSS